MLALNDNFIEFMEFDSINFSEFMDQGFEFKWKDKSYTAPAEWTRNYPDANVQLISRENFWSFIL